MWIQVVGVLPRVQGEMLPDFAWVVLGRAVGAIGPPAWLVERLYDTAGDIITFTRFWNPLSFSPSAALESFSASAREVHATRRSSWRPRSFLGSEPYFYPFVEVCETHGMPWSDPLMLVSLFRSVRLFSSLESRCVPQSQKQERHGGRLCNWRTESVEVQGVTEDRREWSTVVVLGRG